MRECFIISDSKKRNEYWRHRRAFAVFRTPLSTPKTATTAAAAVAVPFSNLSSMLGTVQC